jgi:hypothetical protein
MGVNKILKLVISKPVSLALTIIVPLSIVSWHMVVSFGNPVHLKEIPVVGNSNPRSDDKKRLNINIITRKHKGRIYG